MSRPAEVLLVDDNPEALDAIGGELRSAGYRVRTARGGRAAWEQFRAQRPALVISDIRMPDRSGIDLLRRIRSVSDVPVILLTARADVGVAVSALREGATDFVRFPEETGELLRRAQELLPPRCAPEPEDAASRLLSGESAAMTDLRSRVRSLAALDVPVLVSGEPGTGRLRAATALHALSTDCGPLVVVAGPGYDVPTERCAVVLRDLDGWPSDAQSRWAEALRQRPERFPRTYTIGSPTLAAGVERGEVRRDLWLRTSRFRVDVPSLRQRAPEIPRLAQEALAEFAARHERAVQGLSAGALDSLQRRPWRGNLPELREVLEQAVAFAEGATITRDAIERAVEAVLAAREDSLANRRAAKQSADRAQLVDLLRSCGGNVAEVARRLGMTRGAITYRLRKHGLTR